jgi:hypothetical protein
MTSSEHLIWMICAAFYLSDLIRYCAPNKLIIVKYGSRWVPQLPFYRFLIRNRAFALLNPLTPWSTTISVAWLSDGHRTRVDTNKQHRLVKTLSGRLFFVRIAGCVTFLGLFIVGPITTEFVGIGMSLVLVAPLIAGMWFVTCTSLVINRRRLELDWGALAWLLIECIICPGYFANIWRRLLLRRPSAVDAIVFCAPTLDATASRALLGQLESYFEDLQERDAISAGDRQAFSAYRGLLGGRSVPR